MSAQQEFQDGDCGGNAAPYVLGALTDAEHEAFVLHLAACSVCREEVAALQTVVATLPAAVPQLTAPPELKRDVMAEVRSEALERRASGVPAERRRSRHARAQGTPRRVWWPVLAPVAAGLAVVALLAAALLPGSGSSKGVRVIRAAVSPPGASAVLRLNPAGRGELSISGMPQTGPGRVYEVWVNRSGTPRPTDALFTVTSAGAATVGVPGSIAGVKQIMVTSEPAGGSSVPTTTPVIVANLG